MAYNTKPIVTDVGGNPISQYYNKELDRYEPVEGSGGGNKVVLYNADGSENDELSLIPILDKLSQLTGTVIDEETRKSNELQRIEFYNQLQQMLADGDLKGDKGDTGLGLEFDWQGTSLGIRIEGDTEYVYVDLRGPKGDKGETGNMENLNAQHIEGALGYVPADADIIGQLADLTTEEKANLVLAINEVKKQFKEIEDLGIGVDKDLRVSGDLDLETSLGWVATDANTINRPPSPIHYWLVRTERRLEGRYVQTAQAAENSPRPSIWVRKSFDGGWTSWEQVATTDKIDVSCTPATGYTIVAQNNYQINNVIYYNISVRKIDSSPFSVANNVIVCIMPTGKIGVEVTGSFAGHSAGTGWLSSGMALFTNTGNVHVAPNREGVTTIRINGVVIL